MTETMHTILLSPKAARFAAAACTEAAAKRQGNGDPDDEMDATYFATIAATIREQMSGATP